LQERVRSGKGQSIDITLHDSAISALHPYTPNYLYSGRVPLRSGNAHPNISPYDTYNTRTTPIFLAVGNDRQFEKLVTLLGQPGLAQDPRFKTNPNRVRARDELKHELENLLVQWNCDELAEKLIRNGVPCGPVRSVDQVLAHPHTSHRGMLVEIGEYRGIGAPIKMSRNQPSYRLRPPQLGEHNGEF